MVNVIMLEVEGNFYSTKVFQWMHENGIRMYDEQHGVVENTYVVPDTNIAILYNLDQKRLDSFQLLNTGESTISFNRVVSNYFEADSLKSVIDIYEKGKSRLIENARKDAITELRKRLTK